MRQPDKTVLIIDDDTALRNALQLVLQHVGYRVATAYDGEHGLDILRSMRTAPDLILLDLNMPVMTGWEFRRAQKRDTRIAHIPVVVFSADRSLTELPFAIDAVECLQKPLDFARLVERIDNIISVAELVPVA